MPAGGSRAVPTISCRVDSLGCRVIRQGRSIRGQGRGVRALGSISPWGCTMNSRFLSRLAAVAAAFASVSTTLGADGLSTAIAPVTNPVFFESPLIQSEVRPVVMLHRADPGFLGGRADVRLYAVQVRYASTEKLAFMATKDGYVEIDPAGPAHLDGWADLAAGLKYEWYRDDEHQVVVTPGFTFDVPTGSSEVFQGNGKGEANVFV